MKNIKNIAFTIFSSFFIISCSGIDDAPLPVVPTLPTVVASLYATSNTSETVAIYDLMTPFSILSRFVNSGSADSEGIFYDETTDELILNSRAQASINVYNPISNVEDGASLNLLISSAAELESPRDIAVSAGMYVVSDNADLDGDPTTAEGRFFIFERSGSAITLRNTVTVNFAVWGIEFIDDVLYAVVDNTANVASFDNFLTTYTTDAVVIPTKQISIEGIARIHGIAEDEGYVVFTDIGDAASATDGGFQIINKFVSKFNTLLNGGTLAFAGNQFRVSGNLTELGNPVSVDYDHERKTVFIAERANEGGKILFFTETGTGGNLIPNFSVAFEGASSVFFNDI